MDRSIKIAFWVDNEWNEKVLAMRKVILYWIFWFSIKIFEYLTQIIKYGQIKAYL